MSWLAGLGGGLQQAGNRIYQTAQQQQELAIRQQHEALSRALQQKQLEESMRQHDLQQTQWAVGNTPENTELSAEEAARRRELGFGAFVKEAPIYSPPEMRNAPGVTDMGGAVTAPPRQGFLSVPTEDARARSSYLAQTAATNRNSATIAGANYRAEGRWAAQQRIADAALKLKQEEFEADKINDVATREALKARIANERSRLGIMAQRLAFDQDSTAIDQEIDLYEADQRARGRANSQDRFGALIQALQGGQPGAQPTAPPQAPAVAAPPAPTRPAVPNYGGGPKAAPARKPALNIPPPKRSQK